MEQDINLKEIDLIVKDIGTSPDSVIPILQAIQAKYKYLPEKALKRVCDISDITPASITGVSTFYTQFRHKPVGAHNIHVCVGTACHVKGAELVYDSFMRNLKIKDNNDTDPLNQFTVHKVSCLGCCTLAPVVQIDDITYGHVQPEGVSQIIHDFKKYAKKTGHKKHKSIDNINIKNGEIRIGLGSCCVASGSGKVQEELIKTLVDNKININVKRVGCVGMCHQTPLMEITLPGKNPVFYANVQSEEVKNIILRHFKPKGFHVLTNSINNYLHTILTDSSNGEIKRYPLNVREKPVTSFLGPQVHIATEHSGVIDPVDINEYRERGGFTALQKCLSELSPDEIITSIKKSELRGRGGAGFPAGEKWEIVKNNHADEKIIICNGDEGDPGAFMDRMLLESYPYRIIEGIIIAAYAVGASTGYFYIRAEYPLAVKRINEALAKSRQAGLLGNNILNSGFSFELKVKEGAGAFVCGEETALIASIEGKRGMPRIRPPFPAEKGLWGKPTLVNNTETYSLVPWIFRNGSETFARLGTEKSKGTKVFALAGKIARGGLIEVPMGITIRQIVEDIGGGIAGGKRFKAVQIGGPSGGCVPAELADTGIDFEALNKVGAMMGSGGLLVMDESDCMVDIARYFLSFTQDQSCGKCTFCRVGTRRMLDILDRLCEGKGSENDIDDLDYLAHKTKQGSLCGLGKTAPNPILTTLRYFRQEYLEHINGTCRAKKCKALIKYSITDKCIGCTICAQNCPVNAIGFTPYEPHIIDQEACIKCDTCRQVCPVNAVEVI